MYACVNLCAHAYIYEIDSESLCKRGRGREVGEGAVCNLLSLRSGPYTNNFMGICCLQSSVLSRFKVQREL